MQGRRASQLARLKRNTRARTELDALRRKLAEAEETLQAIRRGAVDAVVISGTEGEQVYAQRCRAPCKFVS